MNIKYQRSPKIEQFITAKISGNALKQGSRTHSVLRQRSPHLQKYKATRMSRRIAVNQKACGWDGGHPGSGPALESAGLNARPRRGVPPDSGVITSSCSVNRAMTFLMKLL